MNTKLSYQLVLQFLGESLEDYDRLIEIEEILEDNLGLSAEVNGHDFGSEEMNIFIYSDNPEECFQRAKKLIEGKIDVRTMKAAFRHEDSSDYKILWPKELAQFTIS